MTDITSLWAAGRRRRDLYREGMAAFNKGQFDSAIARLGQIADEDNLHGRLARFYVGRAHQQSGLAALAAGDWATAVGHLQMACRHNPAGGELARFLAVGYARLGQMEMAVAPLERAVAADRQDQRARVMLALAQWRTGQSDLAELTLHEGLGATGRPAAILLHLALLAALAEQWDRVEHYLVQCVQADEQNALGWRYLGLACGAQGRVEQALAHLRKAQSLAPSNPHIALELVYASMAAGQGAAPVRRLRLAELTAASPRSAGDPGEDEDLDRLAMAIVAEPEFVQAFLDLEPSPMDEQIFGVLSLSLIRAVQARPAYADLRFYASKVNQRLGRLGEAIDSVEQALAINPRYVAALILAAGLYHQTAQRTTAADRLRAAVAAGGDYPDVHLLLGHVYRELGQTDQARRSYQRALELKPHYEPACQALATLAA